MIEFKPADKFATCASCFKSYGNSKLKEIGFRISHSSFTQSITLCENCLRELVQKVTSSSNS